MYKKTTRFLSEVRLELKRTTWPSGGEGRGTTGVVIVTVLDEANAPAAGATVTGLWTHEPSSGGSIEHTYNAGRGSWVSETS